MQCNAMEWNAMECNGMQWNAMECNGMQCDTMECNALQCNAMQCNAMQCNAMQCNAMQCNAMQFSVMQCNAMQAHQGSVAESNRIESSFECQLAHPARGAHGGIAAVVATRRGRNGWGVCLAASVSPRARTAVAATRPAVARAAARIPERRATNAL